MTIVDRIAKALGYAPMQGRDQLLNKLTKAMTYYIGVDSPVWREDNPEKYVEDGYARNIDVYSIVNYIAKKGSKVDIQLCRSLPNGEEETIGSHPVLDLLYSPNPDQGKMAFMEQALGFYALSGNSYTYLLAPDAGPNKGRPLEMYQLPSPWVEVIGGDYRTPVRGYQIYTYGNSQQVQFTLDEIIHTKAAQYLWGEGQEKYGMSPMRAAWYSVQTSNSGYTANKKGLDNMGPPGVLFDKGTSADEMSKTYWTSDQQRMMEDKLRRVSGTKNAGTIMAAVGDLGWINFGLSAVDMAILDTLEFTLADMCNAFGLQDMLFNSAQGKTYTNLAEARQMAWTDSILPIVDRLLDDYTRKLLPRYSDLKDGSYYLKSVTSNIPELQKDMGKLADWLSKADWLTLNEKREQMGMEPLEVEGMDEVYISAGMQPLLLSGMDIPQMMANANADSLPRE